MGSESASRLELKSEQDIVRARQAVRKLAQDCTFSLVEQTKLVTAASELARNTLVHGGGGYMTMGRAEEGLRSGIRLVFEDAGPGIPDLSLAMTDGWTSGNGMGLGLTGAKRLASEFDIVTGPGMGTRVTIVRWR
ncbi:MAG TPA: anti-sigma regulatory factor [Gemmatimonadales bacterium]|nr:anti-sigma regulatory factor [Gemmatimonadales bacterium]